MSLITFIPIIVLIMLSGLFSGLTLGLLSLDVNQLEVNGSSITHPVREMKSNTIQSTATAE